MHSKSIRRSLVGSIMIGAITFYALYTLSFLALGAVVLIAAVVASLSYYKAVGSAFAMTAFMVLPVFQLIALSGLTGTPLTNFTLMCIMLFFAAFILNIIDWFGSLVGIWLGFFLVTLFGPLMVLPSISVISAYRGVRSGVSSALMFALFGIFLMWSPSFGYSLPDIFSSYKIFFPDTNFVVTLYFPSLLLSVLLGPEWMQTLSSSWTNLIFNFTPIYFLLISATLIAVAHFGKRLMKRIHLNAALSNITATILACFVAGALLFGSMTLILTCAALPLLMILAYHGVKPLLASKPRLSLSGLKELFASSAINDAIRFDKNEGVIIEMKPGKSASMSNHWQKIKGVDDIKSDLIKALALPMKFKKEAEKYGVKPAKGILLYGPPGTGKTTLLRGLASQLGVKYTEINPAEILSKWYGESEQRISEVFSEARDSAPCILAVNDVDSIGKERTSYKSDDVTPRVLNVMLIELDKIMNSNVDVIVVATTNKPQLLDKALIRPGRFDKIIYVGPPDEKARVEIFRSYLQGKAAVPSEINHESLAKLSERFTGADIEAVVNKVLSGAFYEEVKDKKGTQITQAMLEESIKSTRPSLDFAMLEEYERFRVEFQRDRKVLKGWESGIPDVCFDDIGGLDEVKAELRESFELPLRRPDLMEKLKVRPVKGTLLYGPPGNGKTLLAKAIATEIEANFFVISGAELAKGGATEASTKIKELFNLAKENSPAIIFIDEIDQIAPDRSKPDGKIFTPVTTQILSEMDGISELKGVMVLAATNRHEAIDSALLRSGRIEKHIYVPIPDEKGREEILTIFLREANLGKDVIIRDLVYMTEGFSGADLQEFVNDAKKSVIRQTLKGEARDWIGMDDFREALQRKKKSELRTPPP